MRRREFLRGLAGVAAAPVAVAVGLANPKLKRDTAMAENFRRTYGPKGWGKTFHSDYTSVNFERQQFTAMRQLAMYQRHLIRTMRKNGFRYVGRVHDSIEFEMPKGGR